MPVPIHIPISDQTIRSLHAGDTILLNGIMLTGRDMAHKWLHERFIERSKDPPPEDKEIYTELKTLLNGGLIYHCGPIVSNVDSGSYDFISAGPTTSLREEAYQADIIRHFNLKGVIGKGGMGEKTLAACAKAPAVYFHTVGGAAALIAKSVEKVIGVHKLDFGVPEAMWVIQVRDFPAVVTMDTHGVSLHRKIQDNSCKKLHELIG